MNRLSYEESCKVLGGKYIDIGEIPPMPANMPQYDDEILGVNFFKTSIGDGDDLSNLTLPRTFIGRSEVAKVVFSNCDFTESNMCWNDFNDVDLSSANLYSADMRSSNFINVKFNNANLENVDFRHSIFENCVFTGAKMINVKLNICHRQNLLLSPEQISQISWVANDGPEPDGG